EPRSSYSRPRPGIAGYSCPEGGLFFRAQSWKKRIVLPFFIFLSSLVARLSPFVSRLAPSSLVSRLHRSSLAFRSAGAPPKPRLLLTFLSVNLVLWPEISTSVFTTGLLWWLRSNVALGGTSDGHAPTH